MKNSYRIALVLIGTITAFSLYAFWGTNHEEKKSAGNLQSLSSTALLNERAAPFVDGETGFPVLKYHHNSLIFTTDIPEAVAFTLSEQLTLSGFFTVSSARTMILGREPNNYILFYETEGMGAEKKNIEQLQGMLNLLSASVFNHQPLVIKVINKKKEILKVIVE